MATRSIPILGNAIPDSSGKVYWQPYSISDSGAVIDPQILVFTNSGTKDGARLSFFVPDNYVGSPVLIPKWTADATTGTLTWDWSLLSLEDGEDVGGAATRTTETGTETKSGTAFLLQSHSITLTAGDYEAGDLVNAEIFRDSVTDTMAAAALLFGLKFQYSDV